jgi:hypothetical protein
MHKHDRKRRLPVVHRGKRVPNLYTRPKRPDDTAYGDTFEVVFRDDSGKQRQKTLAARSVQRAIEEAEEYRTQLRRGEVLPPSHITVDKVAGEYFDVLEGLVSSEGHPRSVPPAVRNALEPEPGQAANPRPSGREHRCGLRTAEEAGLGLWGA